MAEREPGFYRAKLKSNSEVPEGWQPVSWEGGVWWAIGLEKAPRDDDLDEIGERIELRLTAAEITGPEGVAAYDLTEPAAQMRLSESPGCTVKKSQDGAGWKIVVKIAKLA